MSEETNSPRYPQEGKDILDRLTSWIDDLAALEEELSHIQKPYSLGDIMRLYRSGEGNAELLLQHCLIIAIRETTGSKKL